MKLLIATTNRHKLKEFRALFKRLPKLKLVSLNDLPSEKIREVKEDGKTFEENAVKKALGYASQSGLLTLAEDSGICVDALRGKPGVYSARFAGPGKSDLANCKKLLRALKKTPLKNRKAHYESVIAIASPEKLIGVVNGKVAGFIDSEMKGKRGFGYDPLFHYPPFHKTFGQVSEARKNKVSHRSKSAKKSTWIISTYLSSIK